MSNKDTVDELSIWTPEAELLLKQWSEKAGCFRWLHDKCEKKYRRRYYLFSIPVIVLSTLTGTANFGMSSYIDPESENTAKAIVGGFNIFCAIISTIQQFMKVAEQMESHRASGVAWSKICRNIQTELALDHNRRSSCHDFLNICRAEYDRLIEQSPLISEDIINIFKSRFTEYENISRPNICNGLEECNIFKHDKCIDVEKIIELELKPEPEPEPEA